MRRRRGEGAHEIFWRNLVRRRGGGGAHGASWRNIKRRRGTWIILEKFEEVEGHMGGAHGRGTW